MKRPLGTAIALLAAIATATAAACGGAEPESSAACVSTMQYFTESVWEPVLLPRCLGCHIEEGFAGMSRFVLRQGGEPGYLEANLAVLEEVATYDYQGEPLLLLKPVNAIEHGGGHAIEEDSSEYRALQGLLARFQASEGCDLAAAPTSAEGE